jgi:hypothetical protein
MKKPVRAQTTAKRNRAAEVHYLSEQRQSDRMNKQMKSLQELIPNSYKRFKVEELRMVHQSSSKVGNVKKPVRAGSSAAEAQV